MEAVGRGTGVGLGRVGQHLKLDVRELGDLDEVVELCAHGLHAADLAVQAGLGQYEQAVGSRLILATALPMWSAPSSCRSARSWTATALRQHA